MNAVFNIPKRTNKSHMMLNDPLADTPQFH